MPVRSKRGWGCRGWGCIWRWGWSAGSGPPGGAGPIPICSGSPSVHTDPAALADHPDPTLFVAPAHGLRKAFYTDDDANRHVNPPRSRPASSAGPPGRTRAGHRHPRTRLNARTDIGGSRWSIPGLLDLLAVHTARQLHHPAWKEIKRAANRSSPLPFRLQKVNAWATPPETRQVPLSSSLLSGAPSSSRSRSSVSWVGYENCGWGQSVVRRVVRLYAHLPVRSGRGLVFRAP